jgi:hypothetical protein
MFEKRRLRKHGLKARAVIRSCDMTGLSNSHGARKWKLDLEVTYEDGTTGEASCTAWELNLAAGFGPRETVPVLYDPNDRSEVEVDEAGLKSESEERRAGLRASAARLEGELRARGGTPPGASPGAPGG